MNTADRELMQTALEAMEHLHRTGDTQVFDMYAAPEIIPALRERLAQPEQEPVAWGVFDGPNLHDMFFAEEDAQDMARLKGVGSVVRPLTTPPAAQRTWVVPCIKGITIDPVTGNVGIGTPAQPEQEPVPENFMDALKFDVAARDARERIDPTSVYTTPPAAPVQEPVAWMVYKLDGQSVYVTDNPTDFKEGQRALPLYTTPPAAQRKPQYNKTEMNCFVQDLYDQKMREGKRGHYETMFHVVHRAIEAVHGIKEST
jgi:hypothetical protein